LPDESFIRLWKTKIATGAAAGVSGFTGDHGLPLLDDPHCLRGLALLVQLIRNGQLNDRCRQLLLSCPVIAVSKRSGGIRPITIGESLYKMAATHALNEVQTEAVDILGLDQFALQPGGPEVATLTLKAALETMTGATTDLENAFNSLNRSEMLNSLFAQPRLSSLWRLAHWVYSQPVPVLLLDNAGFLIRTLLSQSGCLQGEPLSSLLFCLAVKPSIDTAKLAGGPDVKAIAITDDVTFLGPPDGLAVSRALESYLQSTSRLGLRFQGAKSHFITFHRQTLCQEAVSFATANAMSTVSGCCIIGGAPMGPDRATVQAEALKIAQASHRFFSSLQHHSMPIPVADRLLRLCGVPRIHYLTRVGLLGEYEDALTSFDEQVTQSAQIQAGLSPLDSPTTRQSAPLRNGGFAFRLYNNNVDLFSSWDPSLRQLPTSAASVPKVCLPLLLPLSKLPSSYFERESESMSSRFCHQTTLQLLPSTSTALLPSPNYNASSPPLPPTDQQHLPCSPHLPLKLLVILQTRPPAPAPGSLILSRLTPCRMKSTPQLANSDGTNRSPRPHLPPATAVPIYRTTLGTFSLTKGDPKLFDDMMRVLMSSRTGFTDLEVKPSSNPAKIFGRTDGDQTSELSSGQAYLIDVRITHPTSRSCLPQASRITSCHYFSCESKTTTFRHPRSH